VPRDTVYIDMKIDFFRAMEKINNAPSYARSEISVTRAGDDSSAANAEKDKARIMKHETANLFDFNRTALFR